MAEWILLINKMSKNKKELLYFSGIIRYVGKFCFCLLKKLITITSHYALNFPAVIETDSRKNETGCCLMHNDKIIAFKMFNRDRKTICGHRKRGTIIYYSNSGYYRPSVSNSNYILQFKWECRCFIVPVEVNLWHGQCWHKI